MIWLGLLALGAPLSAQSRPGWQLGVGFGVDIHGRDWNAAPVGLAAALQSGRLVSSRVQLLAHAQAAWHGDGSPGIVDCPLEPAECGAIPGGGVTLGLGADARWYEKADARGAYLLVGAGAVHFPGRALRARLDFGFGVALPGKPGSAFIESRVGYLPSPGFAPPVSVALTMGWRGPI